MTAVETSGQKFGHGDERYYEVSDKSSPSLTHLEKTTLNSERIKSESKSVRINVQKADSNLDKTVATETNAQETSHGEDENNESFEKGSSFPDKVTDKASSPLTPREEEAPDSEVKLEPEPVRDSLSRVEFDLSKTTAVETNGDNAAHQEGQHNKNAERSTKRIVVEPKVECMTAESVQHTITITESDTTETQVSTEVDTTSVTQVGVLIVLICICLTGSCFRHRMCGQEFFLKCLSDKSSNSVRQFMCGL